MSDEQAREIYFDDMPTVSEVDAAEADYKAWREASVKYSKVCTTVNHLAERAAYSRLIQHTCMAISKARSRVHGN